MVCCFPRCQSNCWIDNRNRRSCVSRSIIYCTALISETVHTATYDCVCVWNTQNSTYVWNTHTNCAYVWNTTALSSETQNCAYVGNSMCWNTHNCALSETHRIVLMSEPHITLKHTQNCAYVWTLVTALIGQKCHTKALKVWNAHNCAHAAHMRPVVEFWNQPIRQDGLHFQKRHSGVLRSFTFCHRGNAMQCNGFLRIWAADRFCKVTLFAYAKK